MSLKNVKSWLNDHFSIRANLTILYSLAAFALLGLISLFLYWETLNLLHRADYQFLSDEADAIQQFVNGKKIDLNLLKKDIVDLPTQHNESIFRYYTRLYKSDGQVLLETPGIETVFPLSTASVLAEKHFTDKKYFWHKTDTSKYLVIQSRIHYPDDTNGIVQIVLDVSFQHEVMSDRSFVIFILITSAVCSLLLGFIVTHRGMRSLYTLTDTVKNISVKSLHQRVDPQTLPKDLRELGVAFNQMLDRMESSITRLKQFSSDLAHELRTPIHNLIGETEIVLSRPHHLEEYQHLLVSNIEEYQRISQLIENILFLSRAENPQLAIQKTRISVQNEIALICEFYDIMADEKQIAITYSGDAELYADIIMFRRMISNLLTNAIKYTPNNGAINIVVTQALQDVIITIKDNGIGIDQKHIPLLFDRFYRVDSARSQESGGVGLGLAIVKSIVDLHQGQIEIESEPNSGTTVRIKFPAYIQPSS
jgi:two-component system heavy metal sensor histidine kinase CusS